MPCNPARTVCRRGHAVAASFGLNTSNNQYIWSLLFASLLVGGCGTSPKHPSEDQWLKESDRLEILNILERDRNDRNKQPKPPQAARCVRVFAQDIRLPESTPGADQTEYYFYVWAAHPNYPGVGVEGLLKEGILKLDVIGARAVRSVPKKAGDTAAASQIPVAAFEGGQVLELVIRARDIHGPIRIAAWYPLEYRLFGESGRSTTWSDCQSLRTYAGDLTTRIQIVDQMEARAAFGTEFPRHFYVGRVFMRNNNPVKKLIVYTTSMRAPVYLYRRNEQFGKNESLLKVTTGATCNNETWIPRCIPVVLPGDDWPHFYCLEHRILDCKCRPSIDLKMDDAGRRSSLENQYKIRRKLLDEIVKAVEGYPLHASPELRLQPSITCWLSQYRKALSERCVSTNAELAKVREARPVVIESRGGKAPEIPAETDKAKQVGSSAAPMAKFEKQLEAFTENPLDDFAYENLKKSSATLEKSKNEEILVWASKYRTAKIQSRMISEECAYLDQPTGRSVAMTAHFVGVLFRAGALNDLPAPVPMVGSPWDAQAGWRTGLVDTANPLNRDLDGDERPVLLSENRNRNYLFNLAGFIKRDQSRPMTFQAVLNSLMLSQSEAGRSRSVRWLQFAGRVAGGAIALSPLVGEFGRVGWSRAVGFYSSTLTPELADMLMENLNQHIRNLSEMSMDTIMVIEPKNSVDRYVFFPRGPIFNHPDEVDLHSPAYIVKVLDEEVQVQAELVDTSVQLDFVSANTLAENAINLGKASAAAEIAKQTESRGRLAVAELARSLGRVENLLNERKEAKLNDSESAEVARIEASIRAIIREYRSLYSGGGDAAFSELMERYGMAMDNADPVIDALPALRLPLGSQTTWRALPAKDLETKPDELKVTAACVVEGLKWMNRNNEEKKPEYRVSAAGLLPGAGTPELASVLVSVQDANGAVATTRQSVELFKLRFANKVMGSDGSFVVGVAKETVEYWEATFDIGDADPVGWKLKVTPTERVLVTPTELALASSAPGTVGARLAIELKPPKPDETNVPETSMTLNIQQGEKSLGELKVIIKTKDSR